MGIDWCRARVKPDTPHSLLDKLIAEQAVAFQSIYGWYSQGNRDEMRQALLTHLHGGTYRMASDTLAQLLEFPEWDDEQGCARDLPDLPPSWRIYPITKNPVFPPLWRLQAGRTFLPDQLSAQLEQWVNWMDQIFRGEQDDYLRELHMYDHGDFLCYHWSCLREAAVNSLEMEDWMKKPEAIQIRERNLRLPVPIVPEMRLDPYFPHPVEPVEMKARYQRILAQAVEVIELSQAWNRTVRKRLRITDYNSNYQLCLDDFRKHACDPWLQEFFQWVGRCEKAGFALFLEY